MNKRIKQLWEESQEWNVSDDGRGGLKMFESVEKFAKLVAAKEREACAKVCDNWPNGRDDVYEIGVAIRARGNT